MLRSLSKCAAGRTTSCLRPGWIVEETLAKNLVAAPLLPCDLVDAAHLAGLVRELENPVNGNVIAFNHRGHRLGIHMRHARQHATLVGDQQAAVRLWRGGVFLQAGIFGVIALDRAGMIAGFDDSDKLIETGP